MKKSTYYMVTHKDLKFIPKGRTPIYVGNGKNNNNYLRDNTGINISEKNPNYCELTAFYWVWKNDTKSEIVSFEHYRRFFCNNKFPKILSSQQIELIMNNYDAIQVKKYYLDTSVYNRYCKSHYKNDIDLAKEAISLYYPDYIETYEDIIENCNVTTVCNMLTLRKKNFDLYCAWLFKILFYVEAHTNLEDRDAYQKRAYGFLSERLQNVWMKKNNLKIKEVPMFFYEDNKIKSFLKTAKNIFK
ncbi:DUF4422 domain-containing protein [uncultured Ruminococcus sp.]|uniref:DUF4422 domain-containing protein n=1 Tax=uncultured Ruminococcus sp. TaxID=165186 RepID=UPI0025F0BCAE|nr:DUF4422 domain-containing protein [uncultured Ruminococcus sp.]